MKIHFAPLQGFTTAIYRHYHHALWNDIDSYYTPFVRIEKGDFRHRDIVDILPENNKETPVIPQMLPRDADELRRITELFLSMGYSRADINMGCPFPPIALHKRGSGLLQYPQIVSQLLDATREFPEMKFSVKMRLGWQSADECLDLTEILNNSTLTHITLHPRVGQQQYKGNTDQEAFRCFYNQCRLPLIYNGDLQTPEDITNIYNLYPSLAGIMIGRGLLARPYLTQLFKQENCNPQEIICRVQKFHDTIFDNLEQTSQGNSQLMQRVHALWEYFLPHAPRKQRKAVIKSSNATQYRYAVENLFITWLQNIDIFPL